MLRSLAISAILGLSAVATAPLMFAQDPLTSVVNKLGIDQDVRSGAKILSDEFAAGGILLPDPASPVTGLDVVPQVQLRGNNVQANVPS